MACGKVVAGVPPAAPQSARDGNQNCPGYYIYASSLEKGIWKFPVSLASKGGASEGGRID